VLVWHGMAVVRESHSETPRRPLLLDSSQSTRAAKRSSECKPFSAPSCCLALAIVYTFFASRNVFCRESIHVHVSRLRNVNDCETATLLLALS
jgi:hypothetical protein